MAEVLDLADKDQVVATVICKRAFALEPCNAAVKEWHTELAARPLHALKPVVDRSCKARRECNLVGTKHVDRVMRRTLEHWQATRATIETPKNKGRRQRYRIEGIRRQADRSTVRRGGRDDGDSGGEAAKRIAEPTRFKFGGQVKISCLRTMAFYSRSVVSKLCPKWNFPIVAAVLSTFE